MAFEEENLDNVKKSSYNKRVRKFYAQFTEPYSKAIMLIITATTEFTQEVKINANF